ncbi:lasso peptide biosynthesis PqqD family chaperone [Alkalihalobacterium chitinilyticum]|uniref:Lasso peptide biosynthesis PqqD family chaperone n=1 Tax=Alkalihalobacterium chitinilyticum TaxID=2980103 RepID=A0ABT5VEC4_9BACI|nr:lasso peptide biosynthesis PqqD family chaperone [Alkalihalobacterium chitinilyticum]MDE5413812.1 lasso peptide biosynthesis PqqD family chaperone [Alkalihalobacterium chitinilyticum]
MTTKQIGLRTIVNQGPGNIVSDMDGEKVMLSIDKGKYFNLGDVGGDIWELIERPIKVEEIVEKLLKEYDVEHSQCEEQVVSFLTLLAKEDLIQVN